MRSPQITFDGRPIKPFAGVTVADPTTGATDTVSIGVFPLGVLLRDGEGYGGLTNQPFNAAAAHVGQFYQLQGTASQVTAEVDALVLTPATVGGPARVGIDFSVHSGSGAASPEEAITVENSSAEPDRHGLVEVDAPYETIFLEPFNVAFNRRRAHTTFAFGPGDTLAVIHGFRFRGAGHDTLGLSGADFGNSVAEVLRHTHDVQGSAFVTDPKTGDAVRLAGVTTAELRANPKDFGFF